MPHFQHITFNIENSIAYIALNRPDKKNAMSFLMMRELIRCAKMLTKMKKIRAVILSGNGDSFCSGIDLHDLNDRKNAIFAVWELIKPTQSMFQEVCLVWQSLPMPVIAVLHGHCFGAGMQLALGADFRFSTATCQLSIMEARWGLVPDMGLTQSLRGLVALDQAKKLTYTAEVFTGTDALAHHLVTEVVDSPLEHAEQFANQLSLRSPDAVQAAKFVLQAMQHKSRFRSLRLEKLWQLKLLAGKNSRIARLKDRKPETPFQPRQF